MRDAVVALSFAYNHLLVATQNQVRTAARPPGNPPFGSVGLGEARKLHQHAYIPAQVCAVCWAAACSGVSWSQHTTGLAHETVQPLCCSALIWMAPSRCVCAQVHIYGAAAWATPVIVEVKDTPLLLLQAERLFLLADASAGVQLLSYQGRAVANPKWQGPRRAPTRSHRCLCCCQGFTCVQSSDPHEGGFLPLGSSRRSAIRLATPTLERRISVNFDRFN